MHTVLFLFFYSIGKAFLPLPSLEVVLLPLYFYNPSYLWIYCIVGTIGTIIGSFIGYILSSKIKEDYVFYFVKKEVWENYKKKFYKKGFLAVFIGGMTPFPDFLMAYMAGFIRMPLITFLLSDAFARFLRSALILVTFDKCGILINLENIGWYTLLTFVVYYAFKYAIKAYRNKIKYCLL